MGGLAVVPPVLTHRDGNLSKSLTTVSGYYCCWTAFVLSNIWLTKALSRASIIRGRPSRIDPLIASIAHKRASIQRNDIFI